MVPSETNAALSLNVLQASDECWKKHITNRRKTNEMKTKLEFLREVSGLHESALSPKKCWWHTRHFQIPPSAFSWFNEGSILIVHCFVSHPHHSLFCFSTHFIQTLPLIGRLPVCAFVNIVFSCQEGAFKWEVMHFRGLRRPCDRLLACFCRGAHKLNSSERERERDICCLSLSPPVCPLWQHLLPPLFFPIMRWACPLCCPPQLLCSSQSLSSPSCSHDAPVMTRRRWWELVALKELLCLYNRFNPRREMSTNKIITALNEMKIKSERRLKGSWGMCSVLWLQFPIITPQLWFQ